ncbi:MAG: hypothetical protein DRR19_17075 [Candidatus Parabeggiatoa sp. nov. 1]|nr:MAG: hypothetical protein DRR19_17075 [Gammaproteobacteria bacterium]
MSETLAFQANVFLEKLLPENVNSLCSTWGIKKYHPNERTTQIPLVEILGKTLKDYPDNEGTLRALLNKDLDNKVKKNIYKYIVPGH